MKTQNTNEPQQVNQVKDIKYYQQLLKDLRKEFDAINS